MSHSGHAAHPVSLASGRQEPGIEHVEEVSIMLTIVSSWCRLARCLPFSTVAAMLASSMLSVPPALAQQAQTVTVVLTELQFNPKTITLTAGQPVQLNILG
jgi:aminoglycoside/choline kinase family phosphotransferase